MFSAPTRTGQNHPSSHPGFPSALSTAARGLGGLTDAVNRPHQDSLPQRTAWLLEQLATRIVRREHLEADIVNAGDWSLLPAALSYGVAGPSQ
jgi:hypothetical protein